MSLETLSLKDLSGLSSETPLYAVLGFPVEHSLSPPMQLAAFASCNLPARYLKISVPVEGLPLAVQSLREKGFQGWNCTLPHKLEMLPLVQKLSDSARQLHAVNTVLLENGQLVGFNTDGDGWVRAIREEFLMDVRDLRVLILGTGGAGQALATQAALEGCERLVLVNRTPEKAESLKKSLEPFFRSTRLLGSQARLKSIPWDEKSISAELDTIDLVVNCTSSGLKASDPAVLPARILQPHLSVYDTIYRPNPTRLLEAAREAGARTANGLSMLLHQGALAFEIWTGRPAPVEKMRAALKAAAA